MDLAIIETETETPPTKLVTDNHHHSQVLSYTNSALNQHQRRHSTTSSVVVTAYKECLKNHAANLGGHALDGCGEFMLSPISTPTDPTSLKCAACGCHRNFHRRDSPSPILSSLDASAPHVLFSFRNGALGKHDNHNSTQMMMRNSNEGRKRFRTKFSDEQKEKMYWFSERLGWKMQKRDEGLIEKFCNEVGVGKGVLRVWMHNNKHTFIKRDVNSNPNNLHKNTTTNTRIHHNVTDDGPSSS